MSAGKFIRSYYESNAGEQIRIRVQPETELFTNGTEVNDSAGGPATIPGYAKVTKGNREYGIRPRRVGFVFDAGQAPTGYDPSSVHYIPVMTKAAYDAYDLGTGYTYLGGTGEVISKLEENIR